MTGTGGGMEVKYKKWTSLP